MHSHRCWIVDAAMFPYNIWIQWPGKIIIPTKHILRMWLETSDLRSMPKAQKKKSCRS